MASSSTPVQPDPFANKAVVAVATFVVATVVQFVATHTNFQLSQEGVTISTGIVASGLVWLVSNKKRLLH